MKNVIDEFLAGADNYIKMLKTCGNDTCFVCGMRADSYAKLVEEVKKLRQNATEIIKEKK